MKGRPQLPPTPSVWRACGSVTGFRLALRTAVQLRWKQWQALWTRGARRPGSLGSAGAWQGGGMLAAGGGGLECPPRGLDVIL